MDNKKLKDILVEKDYQFLMIFFSYVADFDCMENEQDLSLILEGNFHLFMRFIGFLSEYEDVYKDMHSRLNYASIAHTEHDSGGEFLENNESG